MFVLTHNSNESRFPTMELAMRFATNLQREKIPSLLEEEIIENEAYEFVAFFHGCIHTSVQITRSNGIEYMKEVESVLDKIDNELFNAEPEKRVHFEKSSTVYSHEEAEEIVRSYRYKIGYNAILEDSTGKRIEGIIDSIEATNHGQVTIDGWNYELVTVYATIKGLQINLTQIYVDTTI